MTQTGCHSLVYDPEEEGCLKWKRGLECEWLGHRDSYTDSSSGPVTSLSPAITSNSLWPSGLAAIVYDPEEEGCLKWKRGFSGVWVAGSPWSLQQQLRPNVESEGAGIAQWLEHRTRDWKVAGSNPCRSGGRIFFSRVDILCWLLFRYPFHPRVTAVARKKSRSFCQKRCRWQVTAKHAYTLRMWILLNRASALVTTCP